MAWGKMIHEKNLKQKSRDTVPLTLDILHLNYWLDVSSFLTVEIFTSPFAPVTIPTSQLLYNWKLNITKMFLLWEARSAVLDGLLAVRLNTRE